MKKEHKYKSIIDFTKGDFKKQIAKLMKEVREFKSGKGYNPKCTCQQCKN